MYDRPDIEELLDAVIGHLTHEVIPAIKGDRKLYFQTLVANNLLKIVRRDLDYRILHQSSEWARLNILEELNLPLPDDAFSFKQGLEKRNKNLCLAIRDGKFDGDEARQTLFEHLLQTTYEQLTVANPKYLATLTSEE